MTEDDTKNLLVDFALAMLELDIPLPIDMETRLLELGIDVAYLKLKTGNY